MPYMPTAVVSDIAGNPSEVSGLLQWYAADQEVGRSNGEVLTSIADRSGNGYTLTGPIGPTWRSAANGINNIPAYEFSASPSKYVTASSRIVPLTNFTIIFVMSYTSGRMIGLEHDGGGSHGLAMYSGGWIIRNNGGTFDIGPSPTSTSVYGLRLGNSSSTSFMSNTGGISGSRRTDNAAYSDASINFTLGSSGNVSSNPFTGTIAEFISYSRYLSDEEWFVTLGYLNRKYSLL